jgi:hypothetical protein
MLKRIEVLTSRPAESARPVVSANWPLTWMSSTCSRLTCIQGQSPTSGPFPYGDRDNPDVRSIGNGALTVLASASARALASASSRASVRSEDSGSLTCAQGTVLHQ